MKAPTRTRRGAAARSLPIAAVLLIAACGGGDDGAGAADTTPVATSRAATTEAADTTSADTTSAGTTAEPPAATWDPGDIRMRVVQLLDEPVDIYVRTSGLVTAYPVLESVEAGTVTELVAPPAGGTLIVTTAGAGDPECVATCPHILAEVSATDPEGPVRTIVMHELDGEPAAFDLWEAPTAERLDSANALVAADPATGQVVAVGIAVEDADFGLRLGFEGGEGCVEPSNLENVLVGGNQTPAFAYAGASAEVLLFDNTDRECAGPAVGGPFTVTGGPGTRTLLVLTGAKGSMDALVIPFVGDEDASGAGSAAGSDDDRALAIELLTPEVEGGLGLPADQAACVAELLVDAIGVDVLLVDGELVALDELPTEYDAPATAALVASVEECGVDPSRFGG